MSRNEFIPVFLYVVAAIAVVLISFSVDISMPISRDIAKPLGIVIVAAGMSLVIWAAIHIRGGIAGGVKPKLGLLVRDGPYRFVRHPVYLGLTIAFIGLAVSLRSLAGLAGLFLLFLPSEIYRARLEEKALARKFGKEWKHYAAQTGFLLPFLVKRKGPDF